MATHKIVINYSQSGIPVLNVLYGASTEGQPDEELIGVRVYRSAQNSFLSRLGTPVTMNSVDVISLTNSDEATYIPPTLENGNNGTAVLPVNCAFVASKTFLGTRRKGRMFLPGVPEQAVDNGRSVVAAERAALQDQMTNFLSLCATGVLPDGSGSVQPGENIGLTGPPQADGQGNLISSFSVLEVVGSQSRRRDNG